MFCETLLQKHWPNVIWVDNAQISDARLSWQQSVQWSITSVGSQYGFHSAMAHRQLQNLCTSDVLRILCISFITRNSNLKQVAGLLKQAEGKKGKEIKKNIYECKANSSGRWPDKVHGSGRRKSIWRPALANSFWSGNSLQIIKSGLMFRNSLIALVAFLIRNACPPSVCKWITTRTVQPN
jgi:hypothetical protein